MSDLMQGGRLSAAAILMLAGTAWGQTCTPMSAWPCPDTTACEVEEYDASVRDPKEDWYPPSPWEAFPRDRRPTTVIWTWGNGALWTHNPFCLQKPWWSGSTCPPSSDDCPIDTAGGGNGRPDQFDWLISQLDAAYARGFRRIMLYLPAGEVNDTPSVPASQWWTMPPWRRYWFSRSTTSVGEPGGVSWWIANHDAEVSIYMGYPINDPCTICATSNEYEELEYEQACPSCPDEWFYPCADADPSVWPQTTSAAHAETVRQNIQPWIDAGFTMFWLDGSADSSGRDEFVQFAWSPDYVTQGVKLGGEAFAVNYNSTLSRYMPVDAYFDAAPWTIILGTAEVASHNGPNGGDPGHIWEADDNWEAAIWPVNYPSGWNAENYLDRMYQYYAGKGFTMMEWRELPQRIFGFGTLAQAGDFNGDGTLDDDDLDRFMDHWAISAAYSSRHPSDAKPLTYYHGDVNNDGYINSSDYFQMLNWYFSPSTGVNYDLGQPIWDMNAEWIPSDDEWRYN